VLLYKNINTSNAEIIAECLRYFGFSLPRELIERKRNKFVNTVVVITCHHFKDLLPWWFDSRY